MDTIKISLEGAWALLKDGFILGAGLPIIFALGVRLLAGPEVDVASGEATVGRPLLAKIGAWLCFALVLFGVIVGIEIIVGAGFGKVVTFEHVFPTLKDKV